MKILIQRFIFQFLLLPSFVLLSVACTKENRSVNEGAEERPISFGAKIEGRAVAAWQKRQRIGVYIFKEGKPLEDKTLVNAWANVPFETRTESGFFAAVFEKNYYPEDEKVDVVAYSPYRGEVNDYQLSLDLSDQSRPAELDLLYANNVKAWGQGMGEASLLFAPQLAQLRLQLISADRSDLSKVEVRALNMPVEGTFDLRNGEMKVGQRKADIGLHLTGEATARVASAFLFPTHQAVQIEIAFAGGKKDTITLSRPLGKGSVVEEQVRLTAEDIDHLTPSYPNWKETPLITTAHLHTPHLRYVTHYLEEQGYRSVRNYSMLYDTELKMAHWVAYPLSRRYMTKNVTRQDTWALDPLFSEDEQPILYSGVRGFDRGHQIPSADRYMSLSANQQTFYFTNLTPQRGVLNSGLWSALEAAVRDWANGVDTLYVVTGASAVSSLSDTEIAYARDNRGKRIAIPKYYYKALCAFHRTTGVAKTIAFKVEQNNNYTKGDKNYMDYALSVAELERLTGFTFFPTVATSYKQSKTW